MEDEMRFHVESYAEDLVRQGMRREEAVRLARVEFGAIESSKDECRDALGLRLWDELWGDLRYAARMLWRSPGFTAVAVISLALGIGANAAIFSLAKEVLFRQMGVPNAKQLRLFSWAQRPNSHVDSAWGSFSKNKLGEMTGAPFPYPLFVEMRRHNAVMEDLVAFKDIYKLTATVDGQAEPVDGVLVSGNYYPILGARVIAGRAIAPADEMSGAPAVAVISDAYWARRFARSAGVLGKPVDINRVPVTIVGVNAPEFKGTKAGGTPEVFLPISVQPEIIPDPSGSLLSNRELWWVLILGRLKAGITDRSATAALRLSFLNAYRSTFPEKKESDMPRFEIRPGGRGLDLEQQSFRQPITVLLGFAGLALLIACANLATLLLARSSARQREMSVRLAMGAARWRVARQVLTEAMLLAILGGAAGLLLGYAGRNLIPNLFEYSWRANTIDAPFDWGVFVFAFAITLITGLLFGIAPAWRSSKADLNSGLKEVTRVTMVRSKLLLGKSMVVFQVSLSLLLLVGAGLFLRTLLNLKSASLGLNPEHILLFELDPPQSRYTAQQRERLFARVQDAIAQLPGVEAATASAMPLLADSMGHTCYRPRGGKGAAGHGGTAWENEVGPRFFGTLGIPIVRGRGFTAHDDQHAPRVAVINRTLAKKLFPGVDAVGQAIESCSVGPLVKPIEIVGVSADAKYSSIRDEPPPTVYIPYSQVSELQSMTFELKTAASTGSIVPEIRTAVRSIDKDLPLLELRTQTQQIDATLSQERVFADLTSGFGLLALVLAAIGIYGIMAYTVSRRTNEIGIRMSLGAQARQVLGMVLRETSLLAGLGLAMGAVAALGLTRLVGSMLYGLRPTDPLTFLGAAVLLGVVGLAAGLIPARRASRIDPMQALRHE
jgi:predicted permease